MRSTFSRAALLLALVLGGCHKPAGHGLVVVEGNTQRPTYWNFDLVAYGERPEHTFRLRNSDPDPVTIRNMLPSCGCLFVTLRSADGKQVVRGILTEDAPPFRIAPGAEVEVQFEIDTSLVERMNMDKLVFVRIVCDSRTEPYLQLEAHLKVTRDFICTPRLIDLGEIPQGRGKQASGTVITELPDCKARILGLARVDGPFRATVDESHIEGQPNWTTVVDANEDAPFGPVRGKLVFETTGSDGTGKGRPFEVPLAGQVVPRIVARPAQLRLSLVKDSAQVTVECLVPGEKVEIRAVRFEGAGPDFDGEAVPLNPDGHRAAKWNITVRLTAKGAAGGFTRTAVIELDDEKIPELRVPVTVDAH
jgi:hypothetical protein